MLRHRGLRVARPQQTFGVADHYVPTRSRRVADAASPEIGRMIETFERNMAEFSVPCFGLADPQQGIVHVVGPEQGITLPGMVLVCGDSHTSTPMCVGMNGNLVAAGQRCASTSNRNFPGRQGRGARTHLMSPVMAAAAALAGRLSDVRMLARAA